MFFDVDRVLSKMKLEFCLACFCCSCVVLLLSLITNKQLSIAF